MATKLLKHREKQNWFYRKTEPFFDKMNKTRNGLLRFLKHKMVAIPIIAITVILIFCNVECSSGRNGSLEDRSSITVRTSAPEGATYEFVRDYTEKIYDIVDSVAPEP